MASRMASKMESLMQRCLFTLTLLDIRKSELRIADLQKDSHKINTEQPPQTSSAETPDADNAGEDVRTQLSPEERERLESKIRWMSATMKILNEEIHKPRADTSLMVPPPMQSPIWEYFGYKNHEEWMEALKTGKVTFKQVNRFLEFMEPNVND